MLYQQQFMLYTIGTIICIASLVTSLAGLDMCRGFSFKKGTLISLLALGTYIAILLKVI